MNLYSCTNYCIRTYRTLLIRFALRQMGHEVSSREAERMIRSADKNGDGLVNYQEFYEKMMQ